MKETQMSIIKIDNKEYEIDSLSNEAKAQLLSIQFVDNEITRLQGQLAAMQTARNSYVNALIGLLPVLGTGDTIKLT
jgi:hypothetical protein